MKNLFIIFIFIFIILITGYTYSQQTIHSVKVIDNYEEIVTKKNEKIILVFSADWCAYCKKLKNDVDFIDLMGCDLYFVDTDVRPDLKKQYDVKSLPTSLILYNKKEISRKIGYNKQDYQKWIKKEING